jgi:AraC-like DNA-binding protein
MEAQLFGAAFAPHRHDTYALGITLSGVQTFWFCGKRWSCLPGQIHILHPDELHDGAAGTQAGFRYRVVYIDPAHIRPALGNQPLPFVAQPVVTPPTIPDLWCLWDLDEELDSLNSLRLLELAARLLVGASGNRVISPSTIPLERLDRVRQCLLEADRSQFSVAELETISGLDRWTLARQFRAAFGTSPSRFRIQRQLDLFRRLALDGMGLAESAVEAGFADQSHMSRHFKRTYGLTPGRWLDSVL